MTTATMTTSHKPIFQMSADARLLMQHLAKKLVGDVVPYEELSGIIDRPIQKTRWALSTALKRLMRDQEKLFGTVAGVGIKRLNDIEIVAEGAHAMAAIRRKAARSIERQMKVDFSALPRTEQARYTAQISIAGAVAMMTRERSVEKVVAIADPGLKELPIAATLKMFANAK